MTNTLKELRDATTAMEEARAAATLAEEARDDLLRQALKEGTSVTEIMKWATVSRARVYQIRDGRR